VLFEIFIDAEADDFDVWFWSTVLQHQILELGLPMFLYETVVSFETDVTHFLRCLTDI